jgi:serine/threonine-protein kinase
MTLVDERRYVLPEDLELIAAADGTTGMQLGEVALLRPGSRERPRVVPAEAAALLEQFRSPATVSEAVLRHCAAWGGDPVATLDAAFPVLVALSEADLLAREGTPSVEALRPRLSAGDRHGPAVLEAPMRVLRDSEVWRARSEDGAPVVVKVVADGSLGHDCVAREAAALRRLAWASPGLAPQVLFEQTGLARDPSAPGLLVLSRVAGTHVDVAAHRLAVERPHALRALVVAVARAYADLHAAGVLQGDVQVGNVLVCDGKVSLLDFGVARVRGGVFDVAPRVVGGEYVDPETAALVGGGVPPAVTEAGEQYSVAALLWRLLTCAAYLDLDPGRERALEQICTQFPVGLEHGGGRRWAAGEAVLRRALSKDPQDRYPSTGAFAEALAAAAQSAPDPQGPAVELERFEPGGRLWSLSTPAVARQLTGALASFAEQTGSVDAADLARVWAVRS